MVKNARPLNLVVIRFTCASLLVFQLSFGYGQNIAFEGVREGMPLKRSKDYQMNWAGSLTCQIISVQFRKNNLVIQEGPGFLNSGKYQVHISSNLKPGDYTLVVVDPSTRAILQSDEIKIKRRIPLIAQIGVVMGIAFMISLISV